MGPHAAVVLALLGAVLAAPQLWLSDKTHLGLGHAVAGKLPMMHKGYESEDIDDFDPGTPETNELPPSAGVIPLRALLKRRRRSFSSSEDEEDRPNPFAGLSLLGVLLGTNLGEWFDETYDSNVKFFRGLRITGNLVLNQLDTFLEEDEN